MTGTVPSLPENWGDRQRSCQAENSGDRQRSCPPGNSGDRQRPCPPGNWGDRPWSCPSLNFCPDPVPPSHRPKNPGLESAHHHGPPGHWGGPDSHPPEHSEEHHQSGSAAHYPDPSEEHHQNGAAARYPAPSEEHHQNGSAAHYPDPSRRPNGPPTRDPDYKGHPNSPLVLFPRPADHTSEKPAPEQDFCCQPQAHRSVFSAANEYPWTGGTAMQLRLVSGNCNCIKLSCGKVDSTILLTGGKKFKIEYEFELINKYSKTVIVNMRLCQCDSILQTKNVFSGTYKNNLCKKDTFVLETPDGNEPCSLSVWLLSGSNLEIACSKITIIEI